MGNYIFVCQNQDSILDFFIKKNGRKGRLISLLHMHFSEYLVYSGKKIYESENALSALGSSGV